MTIRTAATLAAMVECGALTVLLTQPVMAASPVVQELEEVSVTARRREERLSEVPDAISVLTDETLQDIGARSFADVATLAPNLTFSPGFRAGRIALTMRGIGTPANGEPPVALVIDGVQVPSIEFFNQDLFEVDSVQVIKGPQGALYGRGAIAGAMIVNTRAPTSELSGSILAGAGNGADRRVVGSLSGPIVSEVWNSRLSVEWKDRDGLIPDLSMGRKADFGRETSFRWVNDISFGQRWTLGVRAQTIDSYIGASAVEVVTDATYRDWSVVPNRDMLTADDRQAYDLSTRLAYAGDGIRFDWTSGYFSTDSKLRGDADFGPYPFAQQFNHVRGDALTQEAKLTSPDAQTLRWVVGAFYQERSLRDYLLVDGVPGGPLAGLVLAHSDQRDASTSWALFGQANYDVTDKVELTAALRYDSDKRDSEDLLEPGSAISETFTQLQPKASLAYKWTPALMTYLSYGRGFRSGSFNPYRDSVVQGIPRMYPKEVSDNLEVGVKARFADDRVSLNAALFRIKFDNQQFYFINLANSTRSTVTILKSTIDGGEVEAAWIPIEGLTLSASVGIMNNTIDDYDGTGQYRGNRSPNTFKGTGSATVQYTMPLSPAASMTLRGQYDRQGSVYYDLPNAYPYPAVDFFGARVTVDAGQWSFAAYGQNLSNERTPIGFGLTANAFGPGQHIRFSNQPRSYGVEVRYAFGAAK